MAGGRPKKEIDLVINAARIGLTEHQIAYILDAPVGYIEETYCQTIENNLPSDFMNRRLKRYYKAYPQAKIMANYKERRQDSGYCISCSIRGQMTYHIKRRGMTKNKKTFDAMGYSVTELMKHLEQQFTDGMSWDNYGEWHIDHIRPVSWFKFKSTDDKEFKDCWSLTNLQPLWARDNLSKCNRWEG